MEGFYCFFFSEKTGPPGLLKGVHRQPQACLQDADGLLLTQPCKARLLYRKDVFNRFLFIFPCMILFRFVRFLVLQDYQLV